MNINKITAIYFSPTGSTKRVVNDFLEKFTAEKSEYDITPYKKRDISLKFSKDELVIIGVPSFGGRVPEIAVNRLKNIVGDNTPIILVATYGNRDYDDTLLELKNILEPNGFVTVAATAIVTEHSIVKEIGTGRPNEADLKDISNFSEQIIKKLATLDKDILPIAVKGNFPYRAYSPIPMKPKANSKCTFCGICSELCPANAIPYENPKSTIKDKCISCMSCIKVCPQGARSIGKLQYFMAKKFILSKCSGDKKAELFI